MPFEKVDAFRDNNREIVYTIFRVVVGLLFMFHGLQKVFGLYSKNGSVQLMSLMGLAGIIELVGGILIVLGLFTFWAALITTIEMAVAYIMTHAPNGLVPIANGGELALLYFVAFLYILFAGPGKYSLDAKIGWK